MANKYKSKKLVMFFEDETQIVLDTLMHKLQGLDFSKVKSPTPSQYFAMLSMSELRCNNVYHAYIVILSAIISGTRA